MIEVENFNVYIDTVVMCMDLNKKHWQEVGERFSSRIETTTLLQISLR